MRKVKEIEPVNLTPMIDIVFQMIIFFILTLDLDRFKFTDELEMPDAKDGQAHEDKDPRTIEVEVDQKGDIYISRMRVSEKQFVNIMKGSVARYGQGIPVVIYADGKTLHRNISRMMNLCGTAGLSDFSFAAYKERADND